MKQKILVVDDMELNRDTLEEILEDEYDVIKAESGEVALTQVDKYGKEIKAVLLDLLMPGMDGFAVMDAFKQKDYMNNIPVIIISSETTVDVERSCFEYGVADFIHKPFDFSLVLRRVRNIVDLYLYKDELEDKVESQTDMLRKQYKLLKVMADRLQKSNVQIIDILGTVVECRNLESGEHVKRVKGFTKIMAKQVKKDYPEYGLDDDTVEMISAASALHDIGKIAIPDSILLKPGKLTDEEYEFMKSHTTKGCEILDNIEGAWDEKYGKLSYEICRHHHERFDGRGYPDKLKGDEIPISAQIVSVADVYDALVCERVYKSAFSKEQAFHMIIQGECGVFSPKLMECFKKVKPEFEKLSDEIK